MPICLLDDLGVLRLRGADVQKFLQGQLSNDIQLVTADSLLRAGLHNPQGRTLALLGLLLTSDADLLAVLPRELLPTVAAQLSRYVLRAKVGISDESMQFRLYGLTEMDSATRSAGQLVRYGSDSDPRWLLLQDAAREPLSAQLPREQWRAMDIAAGLPQVTSILSGQFVAQMLNLDCIAAVSFSKGCYTGQEVIARAHYRGRVKRRMQRFQATSSPSLHAGASGRLPDGRSFRVVDAIERADGGCEFLAVAPLAGAASEAEDAIATASVAATLMPLPYPLPD